MNRLAAQIQRVLVALDASPHSLAALEAAAEVATRLQVPLWGLFVEDIRLLQVARLAFSQEIGRFSAVRRQLDSEQLERQLRVQAKRARRTFTLVAKRAAVVSEFQVTRGAVGPEILAAVESTDVLVLGQAGWSEIRAKQLGSTARTALATPPSLMLIVQVGGHLGAPVQIVYDGSPAAEKCLLLAESFARAEQWLTVLLLDGGAVELSALHAQVQQVLPHRVNIEYRRLTQSNVSRLLQLVEVKGTGLLIMPLKMVSLAADALLTLLPQIKTPVLLVR
ncbi:MAG: universal stress protein [Chloroflexota bacterium]|nr:universal stress protein [Chloroflexota bacterium]